MRVSQIVPDTRIVNATLSQPVKAHGRGVKAAALIRSHRLGKQPVGILRPAGLDRDENRRYAEEDRQRTASWAD
jgi:hypothetical protein